jgi:hypothetical protein
MARSAQGQPNDSVMIRTAKRLALEMGTEDDSGFWELLWDMRREFPGVDDERLLTISRQSISDLIEQRLVQVIWWDPETNVEVPVTSRGAQQLILEDLHWDEPVGRNVRHLRFFTTPAGERTYRDGMVTV